MTETQNIEKTLDDIFVTEVLILGHLLKTQKEAKGTTGSDGPSDAIRLIQNKRTEILSLMQKNLRIE